MRSKKRKKSKVILLVFLISLLLLAIGAGVVFCATVLIPYNIEKNDNSVVEEIIVSDLKEENEPIEEVEIIEPTPEEIKLAFIKEKIESMSLEEKVCQMFLVSPETLTGVGQVVAAGETTKESLQDNPVGGVILFSHNLVDKEQTENMLKNMQQFSRNSGAGIGVFISVDEEGGKVARCAEKLGTKVFNPMYEYKEQGDEVAYSNAFDIGIDISQLGFNLDFAPVADVWSNPSNTVIGKRAYSNDYEEASRLVAAAVKGFTDSGIICTLKHFPGHGDTAEDSHKGTAVIKKSPEEIKNEELKPFISGIDAGAKVVMMGHLTVPSVDQTPASLSSFWIEDCLRKELGFEGIVITDALSMQAVSDYNSTEELGVKAVQAGNDMLMCITNFKTMKNGILNAISNGEISEERINESVERILSVKYDMGLLE